MNIGLAFYTVSAVVKPEDYKETYRKIRAMGYRFIETGFPPPCPLPEYVNLLKETDLKTSDLHIPLETIQKDFAAIVKTMGLLECKYVTIPHPCSTPHATEDDWKTEYLDAIIAVKCVAGLEEAISHIEHYGSHHTDSIVTEDAAAAEAFMNSVDSAIVLWNASTQFADGGEFGMGAEIGIGTGKMHARGPVGAEQLTTFKYVVRGTGQIRS